MSSDNQDQIWDKFKTVSPSTVPILKKEVRLVTSKECINELALSYKTVNIGDFYNYKKGSLSKMSSHSEGVDVINALIKIYIQAIKDTIANSASSVDEKKRDTLKLALFQDTLLMLIKIIKESNYSVDKTLLLITIQGCINESLDDYYAKYEHK